MKAMKATMPLLVGAAVLATTAATTSKAHAIYHATDFSNPGAINKIFLQARNTSAVWSGYNGSIWDSCPKIRDSWEDPPVPGWSCQHWRETFSEWTGSLSSAHFGTLHVQTTFYTEMHLAYEDSTIGRCTYCPSVEAAPYGCAGSFAIYKVSGRCPGNAASCLDSQCIPLDDWTNKPRFVTPHTNQDLISIWVEDISTSTQKYFDLSYIYNRGAVNLGVWVLGDDNSWYWAPLPANSWGDYGAWAVNIKEALIETDPPNAAGQVFQIDDIWINNVRW